MKQGGVESPQHIPVIIVGSGFGGIALAVNLLKSGIDDFAIFERASEVGGTWRDNRYPGVACDVASNLYSLSFALKPDWSKTHGAGAEIFEYLKGVANKFGLYSKLNFDHELIDAGWDEVEKKWFVSTNQGSFTCDVLVTAVGPFGKPVTPTIKGAETFQGQALHTFNWDDNVDLSGKNVAIIGTGATAIQLVPAIQKTVKSLAVFQRTPTHILPRTEIENSPLRKTLFKHVPLLQQAVRSWWYLAYECISGLPQFGSQVFLKPFEKAAKKHLEEQVASDDLRAKLTPGFRFGCKRPVISSTYFPALQQPNVKLITAGISEIKSHSVVDGDGDEYPVDLLIYSTGFRVPHDFYGRLLGRNAKSLAETWGSAPKAYLGGSISGFPNLFVMLGPFSSAGNQSAVYMLETQAKYIARVIRTMRTKKIVSVDVRKDVLDGFFVDMQQRSLKTSWVTGGCNSYFQNAEGGNTGLWPNWSFVYRWKTRKFDIHNFDINTSAGSSDGAAS